MRRGKNQVLLNYLPGRTFDFERIGVISRVDHVRGTPRLDLSADLILSAISEYASAWPQTHRPALHDNVLKQAGRFILLDPREVRATMFPSVFWCQNFSCNRVVSRPEGEVPHPDCPRCRVGRLVQLRFVRVHRCGALQPLEPFYCRSCRTSNHMALDTRGSERIGNFRWRCLRCKATYGVFGGRCRECVWQGELADVTRPGNADVEVHRAGRTFYPHYVALLNQPSQELSSFLNTPNWQHLAGAAFLKLPEMGDRSLQDFRDEVSPTPTVTQFDEATLRARGFSDEQVSRYLDMQALLLGSQDQMETLPSTGIAQALVERTGVSDSVWQQSGQEILEAVLPLESSTTQQLQGTDYAPAKSMGIEEITLAVDFPVTTATFGFSRVDDRPDRCWINPFPPDRDHSGRFPVFVDLVEADALLVRLDPKRVWKWLQLNGLSPILPSSATDPETATRAYFVNLLNSVPLRQNLRPNQREERMVFGLLHTFSHLAVRQATLLCGLDRTSVSEYILPKALTFALYCNHRFGATIGAFASLYEQSLDEWLKSVHEIERCVYDPVCGDQGASCHACTQLSETSCRHFNLNLSRSFLYGGTDAELGNIGIGYLYVQ